MRIEILRGKGPSETAEAMLTAMERAIAAAGDEVIRTTKYRGEADALVLFGVGAAVHDQARRQHVAAGRRVLCIDLGYFGRRKLTGYLRMSVDDDHPQRLLDATTGAPGRWAEHQIQLREDANASGPILLIGLGRKSRAYLGMPNWERDKLAELQRRFPGRKVIFRPKRRDDMKLPCKTDGETPIAELLRGASLVVCRHSNVAVDAAIAGVPFECEDGAAAWLQDRPYTAENRLDFLRRLAHWQYRPDEADRAWAFARGFLQ